jgi:phage terminase small subunit
MCATAFFVSANAILIGDPHENDGNAAANAKRASSALGSTGSNAARGKRLQAIKKADVICIARYCQQYRQALPNQGELIDRDEIVSRLQPNVPERNVRRQIVGDLVNGD